MTGFLNIDKPSGKSSAYIVNFVKRLTGRPAGHLGTLDPFASGVLPVGLGNANRLFDYFLTKEKTYSARFYFGATTDTLDPEGAMTVSGEVPAESEIRKTLPKFVGTFEQMPPAYSAKSVGGRRSYELARKGETPALAPKRVTVDAFGLVGQVGVHEFEFEITCGAGTYIRALARDLAAALGTLGYCTALRRTASGIFTLETAVPPERLTPGNWREFLIETDSVLPFSVISSDDKRLLQGQKVETGLADGLYKLYFAGEFYGLAKAEGGLLKAEKKLC